MSKSHLAALVVSLFASGAALAEPALRTTLDVARGYRWELGRGTVSLYAIGGDRIREIRLPGAFFSGSRDACPPDMLVVPRTGDLIISSNATPRLWRVHPSRLELHVYDIEPAAQREQDFGFAALAFGRDEKTIYAMNAVTGSPWRIDLDRETAAPIAGTAEAVTFDAGCRAR